MDLYRALEKHKILADGAFGTYYAVLSERDELAEWANLRSPELVKQIHTEYLNAGARLLRTNTFAANRSVLQCTKEEQKEILKQGVVLAKEAAESVVEQVWIAGDIGPISEHIRRDAEDIAEEYEHMCDVFLEARVDAIVFETFAELGFVRRAAAYIKERSDIPVIVQFSVNRYGYTKSGISAARLLKEAGGEPAISGVGFNCGIGAGHLHQVLKKLEWPANKFYTAFPNSGYPELHQDRTVYLDNHQYFAQKLAEIGELGIHILGGCCGTTPLYIEDAGKMIDRSPVQIILREEEKTEETPVEDMCKNTFYQKMQQGRKVLAVELDPPYDAKADRIMECSHILKAADVDMITFADSPMGRGRVDSILMGTKVRYETGASVMPHIACRDKNTIALRAGILGGYMNGIRNLLIVTGDPIQGNDVKSVFDLNSIKLMEFLKQMNIEHFADEPIYYGGALNQGRRNIDGEMKRMEKKIAAGASYFLTQPIYSQEDIRRIRYIK